MSKEQLIYDIQSDKSETDVKEKLQKGIVSSQERENRGPEKLRKVRLNESVQVSHIKTVQPRKQNLEKRKQDHSKTNAIVQMQKSTESFQEREKTRSKKRRIVRPDETVPGAHMRNTQPGKKNVGKRKQDHYETNAIVKRQKISESSQDKESTRSKKCRIVRLDETVRGAHMRNTQPGMQNLGKRKQDHSETNAIVKMQRSTESSQEKENIRSKKFRIVRLHETVPDAHMRNTQPGKQNLGKRKKDHSKTNAVVKMQKSTESSQERENTGSKIRRLVQFNKSVQDAHIKKKQPGKQYLEKREQGISLNVRQSRISQMMNLHSIAKVMGFFKDPVEKYMEQFPKLKGKKTWTYSREIVPSSLIGKPLDIFATDNIVGVMSENPKIAASHPLSNGTRQRDVLASDIKSMVSISVGLIHIENQPVGTGFRVGEKYIITCAHVLLKAKVSAHFIQSGRISIEFGRKKYNQKEDPNKIFGFQPTLAYLDNEYDFAVLELAPHDSGVLFPPALTLFGEVRVSEIHLVGHPGGRQMKEDSDVIPRWFPEHQRELGKYIDDLRQWSQNYFPDRVDYYKVLLDLPRKILFHTTFDMGSSGSPGVMIVDDKPCVVLMVRGGTPSCLYDKLFPFLPVEDIQKIEYGYAFSDIFAKMWKSENQSVKNLSSEIFPEWNQ